ncbi:MAG: hypothetical protein IT381_32860 [Deltaproteobacteria bacterium]|nr:hypothetical protein [Deltaproteobacteria bacterium]
MPTKIDPPEHDLAGEVPQIGPEHIPERVIDELREACRIAADHSGAFSDACKAQAEKYHVKPGALKRFVKALEGDTLNDVEEEMDDLAALIVARRATADA